LKGLNGLIRSGGVLKLKTTIIQSTESSLPLVDKVGLGAEPRVTPMLGLEALDTKSLILDQHLCP
jgi:hypothetical protein